MDNAEWSTSAGGVMGWDVVETKPTSEWDVVSVAPTQDSAAIQILKNIPGSAKRFAGGIAQSVMHPLDTAGGLVDAAAGGLRNVTPTGLRDFIDSIDPSPEAAQRATNTADAVGSFYKDRYGGLSNLKNTVVSDPVGAAADLSTVLGAGGLLTGSKVLSTASRLTNPITPALAVAKPIANAAGNAIAGVVGELGTHTGIRSIKSAFNAGKTGGVNGESFQANMRGNVPMDEVLSAAKQALGNMSDARGSEYAINKVGWAASTKQIPFEPIAKRFYDTVQTLKQDGHWKVSESELAPLKEAADVLDEFARDPRMHTPVGFDAMKQRIQSIYPESPKHAQAQRVITATTNSIKSAIVNESPDYAQAMADFAKSKSLQTEIERALSLGDRAASDTAIRKLQSVTRNNANTNYGNRVSLVNKLEDVGGIDLMPALSGQSLSSMAPRGIGKVGAGLTVGASVANPYLLGLLPFQSPRLMGEAAYYTGKGAGALGRNINPLYVQAAGQAGLLDTLRGPRE
jgi:hypothetical protein